MSQLPNSPEPAALPSSRFHTLATVAGCGALVFAILVGKLRIPSAPLGMEAGPWLDLRLYGMVAAGILLLPIIRLLSWTIRSPAFLTLLALAIYMIVRSAFDPSDLGAAKQIDLLYFLGQIALLGLVVSHGGRVVYIGCWILALTAVYFSVAGVAQALAAPDDPRYVGMGWGPIGTAVTFNRLMFLGFATAMTFALIVPRFRGIALFVAAVLLYGCWASIQKAAIAFSLVGLLAMIGAFVGARRYRSAGLVVAVALSAGLVFVGTYGDRFATRLDSAVSLDVAAVGAPSPDQSEPSSPPPKYSYIPRLKLSVENTEKPTAVELSSEYCLYQQSRTVDATLEVVCRRATFVDRTARLSFAAEALRGYVQRPLIGHGMGQFQITTINASNLLPDSYFYPHNFLLEVAFEGGTVGLVLALLALVLLATELTKGRAPLAARILFTSFMVFMFLSTMVAGDFYDSRLFWLAAFGLGWWGKSDSVAPSAATHHRALRKA